MCHWRPGAAHPEASREGRPAGGGKLEGSFMKVGLRERAAQFITLQTGGQAHRQLRLA